MKGYRWKVDPPPTGRYGSFHKRAWPTLERDDGSAAAFLECAVDYSLRVATSGQHPFIRVWIVVTKAPNERLPMAYSCLSEAKAAAEAEVLKRDKERANVHS